MYTADMSEEETCIALAEMLAAATSLTTFDIRYHKERNISIEVKCASNEDQLGEIVVKDNDTKQVYSRETNKTIVFPEQE